MAGYEKIDKKREKPAWRTSEGRLQNRAAKPLQDGKKHLTGYRAAENEGRAQPQEAARMESSYGNVALGVNRKKEVVLAVSGRRSYEGAAMREDEKAFRAEGSRRVNLARGDFSANPHDATRSAVAFRESSKKAPEWMLHRFRGMMHHHEQHTLDEQVPFLLQKPEQNRIQEITRQEQQVLLHGGIEKTQTLAVLGREKQRLQQVLSEKKAQEKRMLELFRQAKEQAQKKTMDFGEPQLFFASLAPADSPQDGQDGQDDQDGQGAPQDVQEQAPEPSDAPQ